VHCLVPFLLVSWFYLFLYDFYYSFDIIRVLGLLFGFVLFSFFFLFAKGLDKDGHHANKFLRLGMSKSFLGSFLDVLCICLLFCFLFFLSLLNFQCQFVSFDSVLM